jgi:hypothetical protein
MGGQRWLRRCVRRMLRYCVGPAPQAKLRNELQVFCARQSIVCEALAGIRVDGDRQIHQHHRITHQMTYTHRSYLFRLSSIHNADTI